MNKIRPPLQEHVDGQAASESTSDTGNRQNATGCSLELPPRNALASKVEQVPRDPNSYEEIVSIVRDQAECIQELEWNLHRMGGAVDEQGYQGDHH